MIAGTEIHSVNRKGVIMKTLTIKYTRRDFFGSRLYTEDAKEHFTKSDLIKVFLFMSKDSNVTIQIDNVVIYWNSVSDFEKKMITLRAYDGNNFVEGQMSFNISKGTSIENLKNWHRRPEGWKQSAGFNLCTVKGYQ